MKTQIFAFCLALGVTLQANTDSNIKQETKVEKLIEKAIKCKEGVNNLIAQTYYEDGTLKAHVLAKTDLQVGTYTEYYPNGQMKSFKVVR
jgi:antitoxin component YwqK of YwqJK toxin-antitoxin module